MTRIEEQVNNKVYSSIVTAQTNFQFFGNGLSLREFPLSKFDFRVIPIGGKLIIEYEDPR